MEEMKHLSQSERSIMNLACAVHTEPAVHDALTWLVLSGRWREIQRGKGDSSKLRVVARWKSFKVTITDSRNGKEIQEIIR
jgi:hypothetical protein